MTAEPEKPKKTIACAGCRKNVEIQKRLPMGWKHPLESTYYCGPCWKERYYLRAVTMTAVEPLNATWDELRAALQTMWRATTQASNWMTTQFYARDVRRDAGMEKLPPMPKLYLYPEARLLFPVLPAQTVAALEQACRAKYKAMRRDVLWTFMASLPTYRYPTPFPVHNQSWSPERDPTGQRPAVSLRIGDRRFLIRLKGGSQFRRQLHAFDQIASGAAVAGELAVYEPRRLGAPPALRVKLAAWLPLDRAIGDTKHATLLVRTAADCLLAAVNAKDETIWRYNGDHLRRWSAQHRKQLQRWSEDAKYENRPTPSFDQRRKAAVRKFRDRLDSATHEIAAQLAGYAQRRRYAAVFYDDSQRSYMKNNDADDQEGASFPWFELRRKLAEKLHERGIHLELASAQAEEKSAEPLAENLLNSNESS